MHHEVQLPPEPASAGHAQLFLGNVCHEEGLDRQTTDLAQLIMSEIVTTPSSTPTPLLTSASA